jgi:nucleotide-binding universal stress UspA family protein
MVLLTVIWALTEYHNAGGWPTQGFSQSSGIHDVWNSWIIYPATAEEMTLKVTSQLGEAQPAPVTVRAVIGFPSQALIEASREADLLVVGSRGAGGFAKLMAGSVSSQVVHHAHCPVVVVP